MQLFYKVLFGSFLFFSYIHPPSLQAKVEGDTISLGAAISMTGKYSTNGKNTLDGYELAVKRVNDLGGVKVGSKKYKLKIQYYDDESSSQRGAQLAERLINQDGIQFFLGPYGSGITEAIIPITEQNNVPMVEANAGDRALFKRGYRNLFAVLNTSDYYLKDVVDLLASEEKKKGKDLESVKIGIAIENDAFSQDIRDGVIESAKKYGMQIVIDDKLPPEINDMSSTIAKVKALQPDLFVVSGHAKGAALAIRQLGDQKVYVPMLGLTHCESAQLIEKFGKNANFALCASQWDQDLKYSDRWFGFAKEYANLFKKTYQYDAPYQAAESSAAVLTFVDAFERAGSLDKEKVRDALSKTDLMTFYGPIKFDSTGKNIAKSMVLYQIQDQKYKVVYPSKWAVSELVFPAPPWDNR